MTTEKDTHAHLTDEELAEWRSGRLGRVPRLDWSWP